jgi:hypothetical protein
MRGRRGQDANMRLGGNQQKGPQNCGASVSPDAKEAARRVELDDRNGGERVNAWVFSRRVLQTKAVGLAQQPRRNFRRLA